jgi:hypothetical protein
MTDEQLYNFSKGVVDDAYYMFGNVSLGMIKAYIEEHPEKVIRTIGFKRKL